LATVAVEMRGSGLRSVMEPISRAERWNTLSAYAIRRLSKSGLLLREAFPFQFGNFLNEALHLLVVRNGLTHSLAPRFGYTSQRDPVRRPITGSIQIQMDKDFQVINRGPAAATQTLESAFKFLGNPSLVHCSHQA
jgi:hypothetical protein